MRIAHLPFVYYPDPIGGTEVYVHALAKHQQAAGHTVSIVVPSSERGTYAQDGLRVHRFRVEQGVEDIAEMYVADTSVDADGFDRIMAAEAPDILHVHGYTRAVSERVVQAVKARGIRIVFTYHTPTATCMRGTLLRWGHTVCDGRLIATRCAACTLHAHGIPRPAAEIIARVPSRAGRVAGRSGRLATGLRMRELAAMRHDRTRSFLANVDRVIAPAQWVVDLLHRLGVQPEKIVMNRQGTSDGATGPSRGTAARDAASPVRLVFFGRIDPTKGLHVVLDALAQVRGLDVELHAYGINQGDDDYARTIREAAALDGRVHFHDAVPHDEVIETLGGYDAAIVPSQWLETGPLTVLEAFAAGVPVIGSRLGGIAERVRDEIDGLLVEPRDTRAWAMALQRVVNDASVLPRLRAGVQPPRTTEQVAREMEVVYRDVLGI